MIYSPPLPAGIRAGVAGGRDFVYLTKVSHARPAVALAGEAIRRRIFCPSPPAPSTPLLRRSLVSGDASSSPSSPLHHSSSPPRPPPARSSRPASSMSWNSARQHSSAHEQRPKPVNDALLRSAPTSTRHMRIAHSLSGLRRIPPLFPTRQLGYVSTIALA